MHIWEYTPYEQEEPERIADSSPSSSDHPLDFSVFSSDR
jgi:hypothetical protein